MKKKYISKFNPEWIKMKMYRIWLKEVEGNDASAYCTLCKVEFDLGSMRKSALDSHGRGTKHKRLFLEVNDETDEAAELEKKLKETKTNVENQKKRLKIM